MKTLVVAQQKGGVGKTSTLVHIAFDFYERGLNVAVIDLDTQGNASYTLSEHDSGYASSQMFLADNELFDSIFSNNQHAPGISLIKADAFLADMEKQSIDEVATNFRNKVRLLENHGFDVVLIDTPPSLGITLAAALYAADYVISPIELEVYSIQGIKKMDQTIRAIRKKGNPSLKFLGMLPSKVDGRNPRHGRHLAELTAAYPGLLIPTTIGLRNSIADALATGVPVWKIKKTAARKASQEVRELAEFVFNKMEIVK